MRKSPARSRTSASWRLTLWPVLSRDPALSMVGGAEVQQALLARLLARAGYRVSDDLASTSASRTAPRSTAPSCTRPSGPTTASRRCASCTRALTSIWRALREVDADIYYQRSASMLTGVVAEFCRRHGKRSIYAGASDIDFVPGQQLIRLARDRWLYRRGLRRVDRIVVQNRAQRLDLPASTMAARRS